jgi:transposase-like protein
MTKDEFDEYSVILRKSAKRGRKISFEKIELARRVLIGGEKITDVANSQDMKRQQLSKIVNMIRKIEKKKIPVNWVSLSVTVPKEKQSLILSIEKSELNKIER